MQYLLMIYTDEIAGCKASPAEMEATHAKYMAVTKKMKDNDVYIGGNPLQPTATSTSVRVRDGQTLTTDGPFAETKEQLGGYYLLDCRNLDEAIEYAAQIPGAAVGTVEVRPIMVIPGV